MSNGTAGGTSAPPPKAKSDAASAVSRKRAAVATVAESGDEKPSPTKRLRATATATTAPKKSAKARAPTKKAAAKKDTATKAKAKAAAKRKKTASRDSNSDSDSDGNSNSDSESVSSASSTSDTDDVVMAAPVPTKAAVVVASSGSGPSAEQKKDAPQRSQTPVADMLKQPKRRLTDTAIDELTPLILRNERPCASGTGAEDDGKVVVISSLKLQAVLQRFTRNRGEVTRDNVHKLLGLTRKQVENADVVAIVVHGPHTESEAVARMKYEGETIQNYHWSLACWFRSLKDEVFHYDSLYPLNDRRCAEVLGVLRTLDVLPTDVHSYVLPEFFPQQDEEWECGYESLIALTILSSSPTPSPVTEADVETSYLPFFATLNADGGRGSLFIKRLRELLAREKYAF